MISHSENFIFVHIPKTGGTSVSNALGRYGTVLQGPANFGSIYFKHAYARDLKRMLGSEYDRYFRFSVVRNPWDWVVSNFAFNRGLHRSWTRGTAFCVDSQIPSWATGWTFKFWLRWWLETFSPQQSRMLTDGRGTMLVDRVIRFEHLADDFRDICSHLRLAPCQLSHHVKNGPRDSFASYYDSESWDLVAKHFYEDIERFSYAASPPAWKQ